MIINIYKSLDKKLIKEIEEFLIINGDSKLNPLFSSPLWALRLKKIIKFDFKYYIVRENDRILALQLIFNGYRGYQKISKFPYPIRVLFRFFCKLIFGYKVWFNTIIFLKNENKKNKLLIKKIIYNQLKKFKNIYKSPILEEDLKFFPNTKYYLWGTQIIDILNNSYENIFSNFKRNAKRTIKKAKKFKIKEINKKNLDVYLTWLEENQTVTGKSNKIDKEIFCYDLHMFAKKNYIYKIFVAYEENKILGAISIWGFNNFISEKGVYRSKFAKKNSYYEQDILKDWIIKFSFKNNISYYDLAGYNPNKKTITTKEKSIREFKSKFGGRNYIYHNINSL